MTYLLGAPRRYRGHEVGKDRVVVLKELRLVGEQIIKSLCQRDSHTQSCVPRAEFVL